LSIEFFSSLYFSIINLLKKRKKKKQFNEYIYTNYHFILFYLIL